MAALRSDDSKKREVGLSRSLLPWVTASNAATQRTVFKSIRSMESAYVLRVPTGKRYSSGRRQPWRLFERQREAENTLGGGLNGKRTTNRD